MSYAEQKWTVDKVNEKIRSSDAGKDLYVAGVPRLAVGTTLSGSVSGSSGTKTFANVNGSGYICGASVVPYNSSNYSVDALTRITVDGEKVFHVYSNQRNITSSLSINPDLIIGTDLTGDPRNPAVNGAIRFNESFQASTTIGINYNSSGSSASGSVTYILDETTPPSGN